MATSRDVSISVIFRWLRKSDKQPVRVVVEVASPEIVRRLEEENAQLRKELGQALDRVDALHRTTYEILGIINDLKKEKR